MESSEANLDTSERVRIAFFGVGSVATAALNLCRQRSWMAVTAAVRSPSSVAALPTAGAWAGVGIWTDPEAMLDEARPEIALIATRSELDSVLPLIRLCARKGVHVVSTSEELSWPDVELPGAGTSLQRTAEESGVVIAAAGINPGFAFDVLPLVLAGAAWDVMKIVVQRTLDASVFGREVHRSLGIGYSEAEFRSAVRSRRVRGHIGFAESARIVADGVGLEIEQFEEEIEPVIADRVHSLAGYTIEPPETAGVVQLATAWVGGQEWLRFELSLHVAPGEVGWQTRDRIRIYGENELDLTMEPGMPAVSTTAALLVNAVPAVLTARPGFYPPARLQPTTPWLARRRPPGRS
ncbi:MAG: hypothetical protein F4Y40_00275 [Acidimicrobiia bacterium]|nr:hypothetical protein [Acidimicrobiia bacterium]MYF84058.1 hypothetical protein [Acidimicrobiia bacterium]